MPWQRLWTFPQFYFATTFWDPPRVYMQNFIRIGRETAEELGHKVTKICSICSRYSNGKGQIVNKQDSYFFKKMSL